MKTSYAIALIILAMTLAGAAYASEGSVHYPQPAVAAAAILDQAAYAEGLLTAKMFELRRATTNETDVPILVYHIVRPHYHSDSLSVRSLAQTPELFEAQMAHLQEAGYHVITFGQLEDYFYNSRPLPPKPIVLTFDDGWQDQFIYALPILEKYHYTATFFVFTNSIGHHDFFSWDELRQLLAKGMTIGDHTRSHPFLTRIRSEAELESEIVGSKRLLERELGVTIREFAYPFGQYNASTTALVERAGYLAARGDRYTGEQSSKKLFELSAVNAPVSLELFKEWYP